MLAPTEQAAIAAVIKDMFAIDRPIYPVGGGTSSAYGLPATRPGIPLDLCVINRVIDYPARDMTITVEAGITMTMLAELLASERQRLPIDAPQPGRATLGGVIATNWSGPLRYGLGTIRDYVIGITAVDGRGVPFNGGGRVVKNVAGYDFCKLLTGSMGTIGVITQVTLKVKPMPEQTALMAARIRDYEHAERLLAGLVTSQTTPVAIELLAGPAWSEDPALEPLAAGELGRLIVALEGTSPEVEWMKPTLAEEWTSQDADAHVVAEDQAAALWRRLVEFPAAEAALVLKASVPPSRTVEIIRLFRETGECSIQAHAGNGIMIVMYPAFPPGGVSRLLVGRLQPAVQNAGGSLVVLSSTLGGELTRQAVWGTTRGAGMLMEAVKREFDPKNILNPGRFVFP